MEASKRIPSREIILQTQDQDYFLFKTDILAGMVTYSTDKRLATNLVTISAERAKEIIEMNKQGEKPVALDEEGVRTEKKSADLLDGDLNRFDKAKKKKNKPKQRDRQQNAPKANKENNGQPNMPKPNKENKKENNGQPQGPQQGQGQAKSKGNKRNKPPRNNNGNTPKDNNGQTPKDNQQTVSNEKE